MASPQRRFDSVEHLKPDSQSQKRNYSSGQPFFRPDDIRAAQRDSSRQVNQTHRSVIFFKP
ncbi:uncharacterized protein PHALS_15315 [Plasmopara halstedii]|uniref:Uncharacterized protein n=1 Tax=Plasmopara halstedii TaxID=4781 RepID=A0A0P1ADL6_PLAHL|nr:uncharacterized protein PHALS_15315 [Plasmopara halstedii]CEG38440.1 hypothetical protein PHALS_15315 [Plasmopara halstedii]|eukprot:XP_024574809.1 hypothetical protein PHALS_15315 [Plasmopara halstedii]